MGKIQTTRIKDKFSVHCHIAEYEKREYRLNMIFVYVIFKLLTALKSLQ